MKRTRKVVKSAGRVRFPLALATVSALAFTAACGGASSGSPKPSSNDTVKIAAIGSFTGKYSALGVPEKEALEAFSKTHPAVNGKNIEFVYMNDDSDPTKAVSLARKVASDKSILGVIGPTTGGTLLPAVPILIQGKVPTIGLSPLTEPQLNSPYYFAPNIPGLQTIVAGEIPLFKKLGVPTDKISIIGVQGTQSDHNKPVAKKAGLHMVTVSPTLTDYTTVLTALRSSGYQGVYVIQSGTNSGYTREGQVAIGWKVPLVLSTNSFNKDFLAVAGDRADGVYVQVQAGIVDPGTIKDPAVRKEVVAFQAAVQKQTGNPALKLGMPPVWIWDAALSVYNAVSSTPNVTREGLAKAMATQSFAGAGGEIARSPGVDYQSGFQQKSVLFAKYESGKLELVPLS